MFNPNKEIPLIKSDSNQLKQMMLNLFQNAIDVTPPDGKVDLIVNSDDSHVVIIIRDNGPGIKEEDINRIFEPFYSSKVTGVGLGLSIVKKIINDHNGEIEVKNREEGGAEFKITLSLPK